MVNAFVETLRKGQISMSSEIPSHNQGDQSLDEEGKLNSIQVKDFGKPMYKKDIEPESGFTTEARDIVSFVDQLLVYILLFIHKVLNIYFNK